MRCLKIWFSKENTGILEKCYWSMKNEKTSTIKKILILFIFFKNQDFFILFKYRVIYILHFSKISSEVRNDLNVCFLAPLNMSNRHFSVNEVRCNSQKDTIHISHIVSNLIPSLFDTGWYWLAYTPNLNLCNYFLMVLSPPPPSQRIGSTNKTLK